MEISRDALLRVVKATRASLRLTEDVRKALNLGKSRSVLDDISGALTDALFILCRERLRSDQNFLKDSEVYALLTCAYSDVDVTESLINYYWTPERPVQPKPHFIDQKKMEEQAKAGCGYKFGVRTERPECEEQKILMNLIREMNTELCCKCGKYREHDATECSTCKWRDTQYGGRSV